VREAGALLSPRSTGCAAGKLAAMLRVWLCSPILLALACVRSPIAPPAEPSSAAVDEVDPGPDLPILAVPQAPIPTDLSSWRFDPRGGRVAAVFDDFHGGRGCGVWEIESGVFVHGYAYGRGDPCSEWSDEPSDRSSDGELRIRIRVGEFEVEGADGRVELFGGCGSCRSAWAWAPSGHLLATSDGRRLEVWDAETGKQVHGEALDVDGEVERVHMGWRADGLVVVVAHDIADGDIRGLASFTWPTLDEPPRPWVFTSFDPFEWTVDPGARWLAIVESESFARQSVADTLRVIGTASGTSKLGRTTLDDQSVSRWADHGRWELDAATQWVEVETTVYARGRDAAMVEVGWRAVVVEPNPASYHDVAYRGSKRARLELFAAASGAAAVRWEACDDEGACEAGGLEVGDCELLDVSPSLALALADCDGRLELIEAAGRRASLAVLPYDSDAIWRWGRTNTLVIADPHGRLGVYELAGGGLVDERTGVKDLPEVPLAVEHDRLLLLYVDRFELLVASTGEVLLEGPEGIAVLVAAALSPDGQRLAVISHGHARVLDIASGATITSFEVGDARKTAWRQDGAVVFYGDVAPTHAADPATGELLGELEHPLLDVLAPGEIDPSWRWIHRPDGSIVRTLDFARLELVGRQGARVDSGWFEGELRGEPSLTELMFRVGEPLDAAPRWTFEDLEPWLRRPGLVEEFFAGEPLPVPHIPAAAYAKLRER
jgi:hypothetical protein